MNAIVQWLEATVGLSGETQAMLLSSILTILILWLARRAVLAAVSCGRTTYVCGTDGIRPPDTLRLQ